MLTFKKKECRKFHVSTQWYEANKRNLRYVRIALALTSLAVVGDQVQLYLKCQQINSCQERIQFLDSKLKEYNMLTSERWAGGGGGVYTTGDAVMSTTCGAVTVTQGSGITHGF